MNRNYYAISTILSLAALLMIPTAAAAARPGGMKKVQSGVHVVTFMIPMRDGARLATHVYFPDGPGPWPVVLVRNPYGKGEARGGGAAGESVKRGICFAHQDPRGRFESEGEKALIGESDVDDGYDTVEWLAAQTWCTGRVGTYGLSGHGITQYQIAIGAPPHLACQHIGIAASDLYDHAVFQGGVYRRSLCDRWLSENRYDLEALYGIFAEHPVRDAFWDERSAVAMAHRVNAPILHWSGYWDIFGQAAIDAFVAIQAHGGPRARGSQKLVLGPWSHGIQRDPGQLVFPENALHVPNHNEWAWFEHYLKDSPAAELLGHPPVAYYVMGAVEEPGAPGNVWRQAESWPPPSVETAWFFHADGALSPQQPEDSEASLSFVYDPDNPVPTVGGANLFLDKGPYDQREVEARPDVLVFTSAPLTEPMEVTGRVTATLYVASSAPDTDFTVKLCDVYPDGRSMLILDGIRRARFRDSDRFESRMVPGRVYLLEVDLWSTSLIVNKGHRIRVSVSSSNVPRFDANPNTGLPWLADQTPVKAVNTVLLSADYPSRILLPVAAD